MVNSRCRQPRRRCAGPPAQVDAPFVCSASTYPLHTCTAGVLVGSTCSATLRQPHSAAACSACSNEARKSTCASAKHRQEDNCPPACRQLVVRGRQGAGAAGTLVCACRVAAAKRCPPRGLCTHPHTKHAPLALAARRRRSGGCRARRPGWRGRRCGRAAGPCGCDEVASC